MPHDAIRYLLHDTHDAHLSFYGAKKASTITDRCLAITSKRNLFDNYFLCLYDLSFLNTAYAVYP